jgi:hypothetical protein
MRTSFVIRHFERAELSDDWERDYNDDGVLVGFRAVGRNCSICVETPGAMPEGFLVQPNAHLNLVGSTICISDPRDININLNITHRSTEDGQAVQNN